MLGPFDEEMLPNPCTCSRLFLALPPCRYAQAIPLRGTGVCALGIAMEKEAVSAGMSQCNWHRSVCAQHHNGEGTSAGTWQSTGNAMRECHEGMLALQVRKSDHTKVQHGILLANSCICPETVVACKMHLCRVVEIAWEKRV